MELKDHEAILLNKIYTTIDMIDDLTTDLDNNYDDWGSMLNNMEEFEIVKYRNKLQEYEITHLRWSMETLNSFVKEYIFKE